MSTEIFGNIYDIQKFSVHDGPGIRTDIFTKGCPLKCLWCHSPESQTFGPDVAYMDIRCIGMKYGAMCMKACDRGAISEGPLKPTLKGDDEICVRALDLFVSVYGSAAGNLALTTLPRGGVYVAGGISPKILPKLMDGTFMAAFRAKGRLSHMLESMPVRVVLNADAGLIGAASLARELASDAG